MSLIGVKIGNKFGDKYQNKAEFFGGVILILLGLKILAVLVRKVFLQYFFTFIKR